jgi:hypothetical protein
MFPAVCSAFSRLFVARCPACLLRIHFPALYPLPGAAPQLSTFESAYPVSWRPQLSSALRERTLDHAGAMVTSRKLRTLAPF